MKRNARIVLIDDPIFKIDRFVVRADDPNRQYRPDLEPGAARWSRDDSGAIRALSFICPCGCGAAGMLRVDVVKRDRAWKWDGDEANPTLEPSIQKTSVCGWHGYLTAGEFKEC